MIDLIGHTLIDLELTRDGSFFKIVCGGEGGEVFSLRMPSDVLNSLVLSLPDLASKALTRRFRDESLRLVYPVASTEIETTRLQDSYIFTFRTPDNFSISFSMTADQFRSMHDSVESHQREVARQKRMM